jgi:hypothetical protein
MKWLKNRNNKMQKELYKLFLKNISKIYFDVMPSGKGSYSIVNVFIPDSIVNKSLDVHDESSILYTLSFSANSITVQNHANDAEVTIGKGDKITDGDLKFIEKMLNTAKNFLQKQDSKHASKTRIYFLLNEEGDIEAVRVPVKTY